MGTNIFTLRYGVDLLWHFDTAPSSQLFAKYFVLYFLLSQGRNVGSASEEFYISTKQAQSWVARKTPQNSSLYNLKAVTCFFHRLVT